MLGKSSWMTFSANGISILADLEGVSLGAIGLSLCVGTEGTDSAARTGDTTVNFMGRTISYCV